MDGPPLHTSIHSRESSFVHKNTSANAPERRF